MVLCFLALPVFAILGIFSVKYRKLTYEAVDCLFRTVTLRKCRSSLDERIKSSMTGKTMKYSPWAAGFIYKNFKVISWVLAVIFIWSTYAASVGVYNYYYYGNCNGPDDTGFCMFDPGGENSGLSEVDTYTQSEIVYPTLEGNDPIIGNKNAKLTIIEFGCYACPYTKKAEPIVKEVLEHYKGKVNLQFKTFYIPHHNMSFQSALAANCAMEQGAYPRYHSLLFEMQDAMKNNSFHSMAEAIGIDTVKFDNCIMTQKYSDEVKSDSLMGLHAGVKGTPTFFINEQKIVGPKPFRTFKTIIDEELKK